MYDRGCFLKKRGGNKEITDFSSRWNIRKMIDAWSRIKIGRELNIPILLLRISTTNNTNRFSIFRSFEHRYPHISTILKRKKSQNSSSNNPPPCFIPKNNRVWIIARIYSRDRILIGVRNTCLSLSLSRGRLIADDPDILEIRPWNWLSKLARDSKKSYDRIATSPLPTLFTLLSLFVVSSQLTALVTPL